MGQGGGWWKRMKRVEEGGWGRKWEVLQAGIFLAASGRRCGRVGKVIKRLVYQCCGTARLCRL